MLDDLSAIGVAHVVQTVEVHTLQHITSYCSDVSQLYHVRKTGN